MCNDHIPVAFSKKEGRSISLEIFLSRPGGSEAVHMSHASCGCLCLPLVNSAPLSLLSLPSPTSQHSLCSIFLPQLNSTLSKRPSKLLQTEMEVNDYHQCYITQKDDIPSLTKLSLQLSNRKSLLWHFKHGSRDSCLANGYPEATHIPNLIKNFLISQNFMLFETILSQISTFYTSET